MKFRNMLSCCAAAGVMLGTAATGFAQEAVPAGVAVASASAVRALNDLHVNQWVQARPSGELIGQVVRLQGDAIVPAPGMRVAVVRDGRVVSEVESTPEGGFVLTGVTPGRYTIVARGTQAISAFSLAILDPQAGKHLPAEVGVPVVSVPAEAISTMLGALQLPTTGVSTFVSTAPSGDPLGESRNSTTQNYHVALQADGTLIGQLSRSGLAPAASDLAGTNVVIYEGGREIARAQTDANGAFTVGNMTAGCYGLLASGRAGFAAVGFCAVSTRETLSQARNANGERFVGLVQNPVPGTLNVELGDAQAIQVIEEYVLEPIPQEELVAAPIAPFAGPAGFGGFPGGGAGGGFGGGGAGGGGGLFGGRFGGLAALGALGGIAAAIAASEDEDDFANPPSNSTTVTNPSM